jgi:hypothetical protein
VRTLTAFADRMALRAHSFRHSAAALLERTGAAVFGQARRCCEEQNKDCEPHDHFPLSISGEKSQFSPRTALRKIKFRWLTVAAKPRSVDPRHGRPTQVGSMRVQPSGLE